MNTLESHAPQASRAPSPDPQRPPAPRPEPTSSTSSASPPATGSNMRTCLPATSKRSSPVGFLKTAAQKPTSRPTPRRPRPDHDLEDHKQPAARPSSDPRTSPRHARKPDPTPPAPPAAVIIAARSRCARRARLRRRRGVARQETTSASAWHRPLPDLLDERPIPAFRTTPSIGSSSASDPPNTSVAANAPMCRPRPLHVRQTQATATAPPSAEDRSREQAPPQRIHPTPPTSPSTNDASAASAAASLSTTPYPEPQHEPPEHTPAPAAGAPPPRRRVLRRALVKRRRRSASLLRSYVYTDHVALAEREQQRNPSQTFSPRSIPAQRTTRRVDGQRFCRGAD